MENRNETDSESEAEQKLKDGNTILASGLGVGVLGAVGAAISGAVCPVCIVATPALIATGLYQRRAAKKAKQSHTGQK